MSATGKFRTLCLLSAHIGLVNSGRPFARPDALRRHQDRGHCSLAPKPGNKARSGSAGSALPSGSGDPSWPMHGEAVSYITDDHAQMMSLTRQLAEAQGPARVDDPLGVPSLPSPKLGQHMNELDPGETVGHSGGGSKAKKKGGKKKGSARTKRSVKSGDTVEDAMDEDIGGLSGTSTDPRTIDPVPLDVASFQPNLQLEGYGPSPHFVTFPLTLLPQDSSSRTVPQPDNGLGHSSFIPTATAHTPNSLLPGHSSFPYHTTLNVESTPLGNPPPTTGNLGTATGTAAQARAGAFPHGIPTAGTTPPALIGGAAPSRRAAGVSLVQLAVSAATLAQQETVRQKAQADADALEQMGTGARMIDMDDSQLSIDPELQRVAPPESAVVRAGGEPRCTGICNH